MMILVFPQLRPFFVLLYLYQASCLNTQKFLQRLFSFESGKPLLVSLVLLDTMLHLSLRLSLRLSLSPLALIDADFVFVCDNVSKPPLYPLYRGP